MSCLATCHCKHHNTERRTKINKRRIEVASKNKRYLGLHVNCLILLSDFNHILSVSAGFHHSSQDQISRKSIPCGSHVDTCEHGQTDGQTYTTKLIGAFCNYANLPKKHQLNKLQPSYLIQKRKMRHVQTLKTNFLVTYERKYMTLYPHNSVQNLSDHFLL
jgi:hypothetical protein